MKRNLLIQAVVLLFLVLGLTMTAMAQDPAKTWLREGPYRVLDTPEVKAELEKARKLAGDNPSFLRLQRLQCRDIDENGTIDQSPGSNDALIPGSWREAPAVPTKVFDNVYYVGGMEIGGWLIDTGDGYIMLDAGYDYGAETVLIPNMKKLGLDPANVKYILITHAGADHVGAAKYFQDNYGTKVVISADQPGGEPARKPRWPMPNRDIAGTDGQTLTLGDTTITMLITPRTVGGGGLSYFIPVKINGEPHMWATYGNTNASGGTIEDKLVYRESMAHFLAYVDKLKVDIAISSHPFVDRSLPPMEQIRNSKPGDPNPFLIGQKAARRYFEIMDQCSAVQRARQEAGLNSTGLMLLKDVPPRSSIDGLGPHTPKP